MQTEDIYKLLNQSKIAYDRFDHPPAVASEEADKVIPFFDAVRTKNLFLRNSNGKYHFLLTIRSDKKADLKKLSDFFGKGKIGFASVDRLNHYLGVASGALSILSILCDQTKSVELLVDQDVWNASKILCHPLVNTTTLIIPMFPLKLLIEEKGHRAVILNI